ncbi:MAG: hypothetical protein QM723_29370 [Myxococcaceae bacterium]
MKFARFDVERPPGPDTVTIRAKLKGAQGFAKQVELLVLSASAPREALDRFLQGGARLAELADGNLLQVLEVGYEDGRAFLATEASSGEPLSKLLEKCRERGLEAMPAPIALGIGAELAKALAHAHAHVDSKGTADPVTHGAMRSEAVTIGEDGAVKLGGFVPWRAAPSTDDDLEKLVDLVSQWVPPEDKKLVRESAGSHHSAGDLRKAWSAYQALQWPSLAPDARRTLVAFAKGEATKASIESKLGARPPKASIPKWGLAVGGVALLLVAVALLWPAEEPARPAEVALPPRPKAAKAPETPQAYSRTLEVDGAKAHLALPDDLPGIKFSDYLEFNEVDPADGRAPQLFVVKLDGDSHTFATVPKTPWNMPGATELRFFSWEPFEARYHPGLRTIKLSTGNQRSLPLVQPWLEVEAEGVHLVGIPPHHSVVVTAKLTGVGPPHGPVLVGVSYGQSAPSGPRSQWPYALTRLVLNSGETSPTIDDAQELAFITTDAADHYTVTVSEGANDPGDLWPASGQKADRVYTREVAFLGRFDGYQAAPVVKFVNSCANPDQRCRDQCVARFADSYFCWRLQAQHGDTSAKRLQGAKMFVKLACGEREHPWCERAQQVVTQEQDRALLEPVSPHR